MTLRQSTLLFAAILSCFSACKKSDSKTASGDAGQKASRALGQAGESCTARSDCASGLACIANICSASSAQRDSGTKDGSTQVSDPRGAAGESCTARRDCQEGLGCIDNVCRASASATKDAGPNTERGQKGESCASRADCIDTLACVGGVCRDVEVPLPTLTKTCHEVQCSATADCCKDYPLTTAQCMSYKMQCDMGTTSACTFYKQTCECTKICDGDQCVQDTSCTGDTDCADLSLQYCVSKKCAQCRTDTDCTVTDQKCVNNVCKKPCTHDEECPFSRGTAGTPIKITACMAGDCVERNCKSDRECYFASDDPEAKCGTDGKCTHPCFNDGDCTQQFNVCKNNLCVFVGCETDAECRLALGLGLSSGIGLPSTTVGTAVCR